MKTLGDLKHPPSVNELAFDRIKKAIMNRELRQGTIYSENQLASQLGISKTPIHNALVILANKGFVSFLPRRRGFEINELTPKGIEDLYVFRCAVEKCVIEHIPLPLSDESLKRIGVVQKQTERAAEEDDRMSFMKADRDLHLCLATLTGNRHMLFALKDIRDLCDWVGATALMKRGDLGRFLEQHKKIILWLKRGDSQGAKKAIEKHIQYTKDNALKNIGALGKGL